jgi:hypothetical protein
MDLPSIIENYGYAAILIGTFLEGETILVLAGRQPTKVIWY